MGMNYAIGFDVYGTLVDPLEMNRYLRPLIGDGAERFAELWREKQIEYAFRRGLMRRYENFVVCTRQALRFTMQVLGLPLSERDQVRLMEHYQRLQAFPDALPGLSALRGQGHKVVAFSNGVEATLRTLLEQADILAQLEEVISVDDLQTFKPDPAVYLYLAHRTETPLARTWLVSSNSWDVIGAKAAGIRAAWVRRRPDRVFDPWGIEPDLVVQDIVQLSERMAGLGV